jgi:Two component regulator propeller
VIFSKKILFIAASCLSIFFSNGQQINRESSIDKYRALHWSIDEGLGKERWHNAMIKDINGFMWFGSTHGELSRFDGSSFKQYYPGKNEAGRIRNNHVVAIVEDSLHNFWIGTFSGLSRYDIKADTFTNFPVYINPAGSDESVTPFWATPNEIFCIEDGKELTSYNIHSFKRKKWLDIKQSDHVRLSIPKVCYAIYDSK